MSDPAQPSQEMMVLVTDSLPPIPADPRDHRLGVPLEERLAAARTDYDEAVAALRALMSDDEVLDAFGIDLGFVTPALDISEEDFLEAPPPAPAAAPGHLQERLAAAEADHHRAVAALRARMSDDEVRGRFGIDLGQVD